MIMTMKSQATQCNVPVGSEIFYFHRTVNFFLSVGRNKGALCLGGTPGDFPVGDFVKPRKKFMSMKLC